MRFKLNIGKIGLLAFALLWSVCCPGFPLSAEPVYFSHLDINDGLSHNTVLSIAGDSKGCLWFATPDGLNRFDGYDFTVFRHSDNDASTIADNSVGRLFTDSCGRLWIGTSSGLSLWNSAKEKFENFDPGFPVDVTAIGETTGERLFVGTRNGLYVFDTARKAFEGNLPETTRSLIVNTISVDGDRVWLGTECQGLFCYFSSENEIRRMSYPSPSCSIQSILPEGTGVLWVATEGDGLMRIETATGEVRGFRNSDGGSSSDFVRTLCFDDSGRLWVGTVDGLNILDTGTEECMKYYSDQFQAGSLSRQSVKCIYRDCQGGMWLGTFFGGINYRHYLQERFSNICRKADGSSLNDNIVSCMVEDSDGEIWIGTNRGGVNRYNPVTGSFTHYIFSRSGRTVSNDIKTIFIDGNDVFTGAQGGGLRVMDRRTGTIRQCAPDGPALDVYSIVERDANTLWVGSLQGLYSYDRRTDSMTYEPAVSGGPLSDPVRVRSLFRDSSGRLWTGAEDGCNVYSLEAGELSRMDLAWPEILSHAFISGFFEDGEGNVWIGSRRGLWLYSSSDGQFRRFSTDDGLPNDQVQGIEGDHFGRLWISTNNGLSCFNPYSDAFRNYTAVDGLQSNEFNAYSHLRSSSGRMYFGGVNGITCFNPENLVDNPYTPAPVITSLKVFDRTVTPDDGTGILSASITETSRIRIRPKMNSFSISFSVCNYIAGSHNTFAYMLEGMDSEYKNAPASRTVTYSFLPAGNYRFLVKAANNDGKWCEEPASLEIKVLPVWYRTAWAAILFILVGTLMIVGGIAFYVYRKRMALRLEMKENDKKKMEEMHQMKMRFFINISHELRTPLTMIMAPLQDMIGRCSDIRMIRQLKNMQINTRRLLHLVDQQMDYRRAELGVFKLRVRKEDINAVVRENCRYYEEIARSKKLKYHVMSVPEGRTALVDAQYFELIINNLLSNAFKYTDEGSVSVAVSLDAENLGLEVRDTGIGVPKEEQDRIFERFYQVDGKRIGSGIGLSLVQRLVELHHAKIEVESEEGRGSCFRILFPQDLSAYAPEEIALDATESDYVPADKDYSPVLSQDGIEDAEISDSPDGSRPTVLVVEDNDGMRGLLHEGLAQNFNVLTAADGVRAMEIVKNTAPDVVLSDLVMPVMDGLTLCSKIKRDSGTGHICVIILSGKVDAATQSDCYKAGADDFIPKPFSVEILTRKIYNTLKTRRRVIDKYTGSIGIEPGNMSPVEAESDFLKAAVAVVERNLDNASFSVDDFAEAMNVSKSTLHSRLRSISGDSPLDFIRRVRFRQACDMLRQGKHSVSEISYMVGFSTPSYFTVAFKNYFGILPSEYIRQNAGGISNRGNEYVS